MHDTAKSELCPKCDLTLRPGSQIIAKSTSGHFMMDADRTDLHTTFLPLSPSSLIVTIMWTFYPLERDVIMDNLSHKRY